MIVTLELDRPEAIYRPGETIRGRVRVEHEAPWRADYCQVFVFWRSEGRGDMDEGVAARIDLLPPGSDAPASLDREFSAKLPLMPCTYHGHLIKLHWFAGAYARGKGLAEAGEELPFTLAPPTSASGPTFHVPAGPPPA